MGLCMLHLHGHCCHASNAAAAATAAAAAAAAALAWCVPQRGCHQRIIDSRSLQCIIERLGSQRIIDHLNFIATIIAADDKLHLHGVRCSGAVTSASLSSEHTVHHCSIA
eukprot:1155648-Pelagomonas_calceolata.AAC.2